MLSKTNLVSLFSSLAAGCIATYAFAIEVTEPAGAAHGYPGLCGINGKKLADGEFRQWVENDHLHVVITYRFPDGDRKSTRLNSSHRCISYAVFCLKKK